MKENAKYEKKEKVQPKCHCCRHLIEFHSDARIEYMRVLDTYRLIRMNSPHFDVGNLFVPRRNQKQHDYVYIISSVNI